jgi:hypothetical protein
MKRIIVLLIVIVISILTFTAFSETDNAVGVWYFYLDFKTYPEMKGSYGDYDSLICSYAFLENGTIYEIDITTKDNVVDTNSGVAGKWEKDGTNYKYSIIGIGEGSFEIKNDGLWLTHPVSHLSMRLRRMMSMNPYADIK